MNSTEKEIIERLRECNPSVKLADEAADIIDGSSSKVS